MTRPQYIYSTSEACGELLAECTGLPFLLALISPLSVHVFPSDFISYVCTSVTAVFFSNAGHSSSAQILCTLSYSGPYTKCAFLSADRTPVWVGLPFGSLGRGHVGFLESIKDSESTMGTDDGFVFLEDVGHLFCAFAAVLARPEDRSSGECGRVGSEVVDECYGRTKYVVQINT
ncbi:hypothetical protein F5880DRAFT_1602365 [Lentinula raphanica]|nr:hypothetical protein F5880DRAFT_1602365 [Lentinula raphanica]